MSTEEPFDSLHCHKEGHCVVGVQCHQFHCHEQVHLKDKQEDRVEEVGGGSQGGQEEHPDGGSVSHVADLVRECQSNEASSLANQREHTKEGDEPLSLKKSFF